MNITLVCDIGWANGIVTLLGKQPYELVADVITSLKGQIATQVAAAQAPVIPATPAQPEALTTEGAPSA